MRDETYTAFENIYPVLTEFRKNQQWYGPVFMHLTISLGYLLCMQTVVISMISLIVSTFCFLFFSLPSNYNCIRWSSCFHIADFFVGFIYVEVLTLHMMYIKRIEDFLAFFLWFSTVSGYQIIIVS